MKYLALRSFYSFGKLISKGTIVDESAIRSPLLRISDGKITPAVPSSNIPAEEVVKITSQVLLEDNHIVKPEPDEQAPEQTAKDQADIKPAVSKAPLFTLKKQ